MWLAGQRERAPRALLLGSKVVKNSFYPGNHHIVTGLKPAQLFLFLATLFLTACGLLGGRGQTANLGHQIGLELNSTAVLTCSESCADHGWCGTAGDQRPVVLGNAVDPASPVHDRLFLQDTQVIIDFATIATIQYVATGEQAELPFYHVMSINDGKSAWIAGWCIAAP